MTNCYSLSASFILDTMFTHDPFDAYIAISPNFAYDKQQLATKFTKFDFAKLKSNRFVYISHGNENWPEWRQSRDKVYQFLRSNDRPASKLHYEIGEFPEEDHWYVFFPALRQGLKKHFEFEKTQQSILSEKSYPVTIRVKVPNNENKVFISGNQKNLGDGNYSAVEMKIVSETEREITLDLHSPARIVFSRGSAETRAIVKDTFIGESIAIDPSKGKVFDFEITGWFDDED